jgi:hypothetical protein
MAGDLAILDYGPPARPKWLLRTLVIVVLVAVGAGIGAAIGDRIQPDRYVFNGSISVSRSPDGTDATDVKQSHINAIRGNIPAAAATLNAQGIPISAGEFGDRMALKDVPQSNLISVRCTGRSFDTPLAMVNALVVPYSNTVPGIKVNPGGLRRSVVYASTGFVLGGAATGSTIVLWSRRSARRSR